MYPFSQHRCKGIVEVDVSDLIQCPVRWIKNIYTLGRSSVLSNMRIHITNSEKIRYATMTAKTIFSLDLMPGEEIMRLKQVREQVERLLSLKLSLQTLNGKLAKCQCSPHGR